MLRILKYLLVALALLVLAVGIAGLIIAHRYQDEVKQMVIEGINRHISTVIIAEDLSFSVLRRFPDAAVEFRNVTIMAPGEFRAGNLDTPGADTLFTAGNLQLRFNIMDIFKGDYTIKSIHASDGSMFLAVNKDQRENYRFWDGESTSPGTLNVELQDIRFYDYHLRFLNSLKNVYYEGSIDRMFMKGQIGSSRYRLSGIAAGRTGEVRYGGMVFGEPRDIEARVSLNVEDSLFVLESGTLKLDNISLTATGQLLASEDGMIDMSVRGYNIDLKSVAGLLPASSSLAGGGYLYSGTVDFDASISGAVTKTASPRITATFNTANGEMVHRGKGIRLGNAVVQGYYTNGTGRDAGSSSVVINRLSATLGNGTISGNGSLRDLTSPRAEFSLNADLLLEELAGFYQPPNIDYMAGRIRTSFSGSGRVDRNTVVDIGFLRSLGLRGELLLTNGTMELTQGRYTATAIEGKFDFGEVLRTTGLGFYIGRDHFHITGEIDNGLSWLLGEDRLMTIQGSFRSGGLDLDNYILPSAGDVPGTAEPVRFPDNIELKLDFLLDRLKFREFVAADFSGRLSYRPGMMTLNSLEFKSMEGAVSGNGVIYQRVNGDFMVQSQLEADGVDINSMFLSFGNFGQDFIDGSNLKGRLTGNDGLVSEWSSHLRVREEKIIVQSNLIIENGELINFEPVLGLSRFIDVAELQHIRFSALQNEIFIRNRQITIPQMDINSSAFNISGSGTHDFDGRFDYRLRVLLSDVLYGKARRSRPETDKYGVVEDDGLGRTSLYLLVSGTADDYRVSFDHRTVRDVIRENIAAERATLRQILNEEFGWFGSGDRETERAGTSDTRSGFRVVWDEEDKTPPDSTLIDTRQGAGQRESRPRFRIEWDEEKPPGK